MSSTPGARSGLRRPAGPRPGTLHRTRVPWRSILPPALLVALVLLGAVASRAPLVLALSGQDAPGVALHLSPAYLALAPVSDVLDALTFLTPRQHVALLVSAALAYLLWRVVRGRRRRSVKALALGELLGAAAFLGSVVAVYLVGVLAPRPMAAIRALDPDAVVVDFHSHTSRSHDGREGFDAQANRAWHAGAGFDLAWVTDHQWVDTAQAAAARNPRTAGQGTSLLPGLEYVLRDEHVVALGIPPDDPTEPGPPLIQTLPEHLDHVPTPGPGGGDDLVAIELVDGDPRGLAQADRDRALLLRLADSLDLALVASSNLHGWGRAASAWNVMDVPGWRSLPPAALGERIVADLHERQDAGVEVVERRRLHERPGSTWRVALTAPRLAWNLLTVLTWPERVAWIVWILGITAALAWARRHKTRTAVE